MLPEICGVVAWSQTKVVGIQMPKVNGEDKLVDLALKPESQARRERISKPILEEPKFMSQPKRRFPLVLPGKEQGRAGARRNIPGL